MLLYSKGGVVEGLGRMTKKGQTQKGKEKAGWWYVSGPGPLPQASFFPNSKCISNFRYKKQRVAKETTVKKTSKNSRDRQNNNSQ